MNKAELNKAVAEKAELTQVQARAAIDALLETIEDALAAGEKVALTGFGSFIVRERAARTGRNPQTGEEIQIAATKTPAFKSGKLLKDAVRG